MLRSFILSLILMLFGAFNLIAQKHKNGQPNIVYILADDLGYGELGCYSQKKIETPNIDALAQEGMLFTQHYAFPVCAPSRYLLLTGEHSGHAYIRGNNEWSSRGDVWDYEAMEANPFLEGQWPIPDSIFTLAEMLKNAGYTNGVVGKWGLGAPMTQGLPNKQGFNYFYGFICQRQDHTYFPAHLWENEDRIPLNNKLISPQTVLPPNRDPYDEKSYEEYQQEDYAPDFLIDAALKFMDRNKDNPFFLFFSTPLPHVSLQAPMKWVKYYHLKFGEEEPFLGGSYFPVRYPRATYAAMVSTLDEHVGMIMRKLKELGVYDNTIIVFTSDNGPTYNGGSDSPWFESGGPFKSEEGWGKGYVHEGGIRVPLIVSWPGEIEAGSKSDHLSAAWDAVPTFCEITGIDPPDKTDGISYLPTLLGKDGKQREHSYLYWEFPGYGGQQAIRLGKWKGIRMGMQKGNKSIKLFNLEEDIQELIDQSEEHPDIIQRMEDIMLMEHESPVVKKFKIKALDE